MSLGNRDAARREQENPEGYAEDGCQVLCSHAAYAASFLSSELEILQYALLPDVSRLQQKGRVPSKPRDRRLDFFALLDNPRVSLFISRAHHDDSSSAVAIR
jgi:hypothetical protein